MKSIKVTNTGGPEVLKLEDITLENLQQMKFKSNMFQLV